MRKTKVFDTYARKKAFNKATHKLTQQAYKISSHFNFKVPYDIGTAIRKIRNAFRDPEIRKLVLNPKWEQINFEDAHYAEGFCIIASYVFANVFRPENGPSPWKLMQFVNAETCGTHMWLRFTPTGEILDLTFDQFIDFEGNLMDIPYKKGKKVREKYDNPGLDKFIDSIGPEFAAAFRRNITSK